jgi:hypothetical protein
VSERAWLVEDPHELHKIISICEKRLAGQRKQEYEDIKSAEDFRLEKRAHYSKAIYAGIDQLLNDIYQSLKPPETKRQEDKQKEFFQRHGEPIDPQKVHYDQKKYQKEYIYDKEEIGNLFQQHDLTNKIEEKGWFLVFGYDLLNHVSYRSGSSVGEFDYVLFVSILNGPHTLKDKMILYNTKYPIPKPEPKKKSFFSFMK